MDLWIRSQNKKLLIKCNNVIIDEYLDSHIDIRQYNSESGSFKLGSYESVERAKEILDEIQELLKPKIIFKANDTQIYGINPNMYKTNAIGNLINTDIQELSTYVYEMPQE